MLLSKGNCDIIIIWLVVWEIFIFPYIYIYTYILYIYIYIGNVIIPADELIFFRGVGLNHQPVM